MANGGYCSLSGVKVRWAGGRVWQGLPEEVGRSQVFCGELVHIGNFLFVPQLKLWYTTDSVRETRYGHFR